MLEQNVFFLFYFGKEEHYLELTDQFYKPSLENCRVQDVIHQQQSGAVEACWAHNPEVRGSKPRSASDSFIN